MPKSFMTEVEKAGQSVLPKWDGRHVYGKFMVVEVFDRDFPCGCPRISRPTTSPLLVRRRVKGVRVHEGGDLSCERCGSRLGHF